MKYKQQYLIIITFGAIILLTLFFVVLGQSKQGSNQKVSTGAAPASVADQCLIKKTVTYTCYKNELISIVTQQGPEQAIAVVKASYAKDPYVKSQCHQLTHVIGRAAVIKYNDDLGQTYAHGDDFCASGYYHGASEEIAAQKGAEYLVKNADKICAVFAIKARYSLDHRNCVHGLGHGFIEALNGNLFAALKACDNLSDTWQQSSCYSGVFMQNIMIAESPDENSRHTSKYLKKDDPMYPCTIVEERYKPGCYIVQTSWALPILNFDYTKVFALCGKISEVGLSDQCYQSLGRDISVLQGFESEMTKGTCLLGPDSRSRTGCVIGAAKGIVNIYHSDKQARQFCLSLPAEFTQPCNKAITSYYAAF